MGSDDLHHKRRARKIDSLRRSKAKRSPYDVVLIVCEGAKTEPHYFQELKDAFRLNNANIMISGKECGSDPLSVVSYAIKTFKDNPIYDRVYCVFDQDRHTTYHPALDKVRRASLGKVGKMFAIPSVPCFEFWLLIHYVYTTGQFDAPGGDSICARVIGELKNHLPNYEKGQRNIFSITLNNLDNAITNSKRIEQFHETSGTDNPSTKIHTLVEYLRDLNK